MPPTGLYEFRIPYCGCDTCNLVTGDFAECSSYETYGKSVTVEVVAPIDLAPFTGMEQVAVGFFWYEVVDFLQQALDKVNAVRVRGGGGGGCVRIAVCENPAAAARDRSSAAPAAGARAAAFAASRRAGTTSRRLTTTSPSCFAPSP